MFRPVKNNLNQETRSRLWGMSIHLLEENRNDLREWCIFRPAKSSWNQEIRIRLQVIRIHPGESK